MTWEQKLQALCAFAECHLIMRKPGDWYVSQSVEVKDNGVLIGSFGNGADPEEAVLDHWDTLTEKLAPHQYLVTRAMSGNRKAVRWNGFMWESVNETPPSHLPDELHSNSEG